MTHLIATLLSMLLAGPTNPDPIAGVWKGSITTPGVGIEVLVHITPTGPNTWTGSIDTPLQHSFGIPLSSVRFDEGELIVECDVTNPEQLTKVRACSEVV